ncbi:ATP-dependent zinc metalloprotease FtsH [Wenzhouxiangella limi]|uniref:ATP-dependent zinc metalloprotease FtsH n=1 Tax=Wenzhouxiangella limi TaxID=2707351 RepID=A0A845V276_9GAMM|nr:ATP-dependent zinc metalloprotease FtsH [Wenzhouxiangella limi]NDY96814.1 ATP-dependent zinc metalloprotease FtsH [Wenzhouxiangella limi]
MLTGLKPDDSNDNSQGRDPDRVMRRSVQQGQLFIWMALAVLLVFYFTSDFDEPQTNSLTYSEFLSAVDDGRVEQVVLRGQEISGQLTEQAVENDDDIDLARFQTLRPEIEDPRLLERLESQGVAVDVQPSEPPWWAQILLRALPWILALGLLLWFWNRMAQKALASGAGPFSLGRSKARRIEQKQSEVRLKHVAGADNAKREVKEVIDYLKDPERFRKLGAKIPHGLLLMGPPGTGKTLMARAVAGEADVPFYSVTGSEFIEMFVGVGASRVRDMFDNARKTAPSVIFIDELDAIGRSRGTGMGGGHDEREQTLNQILAQMDGFEPHEAVVVLAATNRPDVLDNALLRPGRFDRKITMDRPDRKARKAILEVHTDALPLADDVDLDRLARITIGFSGADLANLANEAALLAGRKQKERIDWTCFTEARDRAMLGQARDSALGERERKLVAYHESGHALLAELLPHADPVDKISVLPRAQSLGATSQLPEEERYNYSEKYLRDRIGVMFGGRLAESIVFGEVSNGAENDLEQATRLARRMVGRWGMSERIGPASFAESDQHVFLGKEMAQERIHSEAMAAMIDEEIQALLKDIESGARELLEKHRDTLDALAEAVAENETLESEAVREILDQAED